MSDVFSKGVQVPTLAANATVPPASLPGFARLVVRGTTLYLIDSTGTTFSVGPVEIVDGEYTFGQNNPASPVNGEVVLYADNYAGKTMLAQKNQFGRVMLDRC